MFISFQEIIRERGTIQGRIIRPMRIVNTEQEEYSGLVQATDEGMGSVYLIFFCHIFLRLRFSDFYFCKFKIEASMVLR